MKKNRKSVLVLSFVTVFLLVSTVTVGAARVYKNAYYGVFEKSIATKGIFNLNGSRLNNTIQWLRNLSLKIQNISNKIVQIINTFVNPIVQVIDAIIAALEAIRNAIIGA